MLVLQNARELFKLVRRIRKLASEGRTYIDIDTMLGLDEGTSYWTIRGFEAVAETA